MKLAKSKMLGLALLILVAGCDKNKDQQDIEKKKSELTEYQNELNLRQSLISQQEHSAETRSNLEVEAFQRANILFNAHEYESASSAYHEFIRDYTLSARVPIVKQRLQEVDRFIAYQKAVALAQQQQQQVAQAAAVAQVQADARLRAQAQAPAQNNFGNSASGTVRGFGHTQGDAYAAARQKLPVGAQELKTHYSPITQGSDHYFNCTITYQSK
jgi:hypothetical protein